MPALQQQGSAEKRLYRAFLRMFGIRRITPAHSPYTIFDIGGNNYRVVVIVRYRFKKIYVQQVMSHREYDDWNKLYRRGKG